MTLPEAPYRALDDQQVRDRWLTFFGHLEGADDVFDDVLSAYRRPGRYYHTIEHGLAVAQTARTLSEGMAEPDRLAIDLASWLHDARFSPGADDNEERSADLAADVAIRLGLDGARVDEIRGSGPGHHPYRAGHDFSPTVVVRCRSGRPGQTLAPVSGRRGQHPGRVGDGRR